MTSNDSLTTYFENLLDKLTADNISLIDFDGLKEKLRQAKEELSTLAHCSNELRLFREDYLDRIAGMVKAITVVECRLGDSQAALDYLESLNHLSAAELVEQYRRTSARFRSAFPTTFGLPLLSDVGKGRIKNPEVYK